MKVLGVDYGARRVGLAISDESGTFARSFAIIPAKNFFAQLPKLVAEHGVGVLVLGLPLAMSGKDSEQTKKIRLIQKQIIDLLAIPVELVDERLTSSWAKDVSGGRKHIDDIAAQFILQTYLDKQKNKNV